MSVPNLMSMAIPSPLGLLWLEASPLGLRRVTFVAEGTEPPPMALGFQPGSTCSSILVAAASQMQAYLSGKRRSFDLPLDMEGTPYQRQAWKQVLRIPYGETRSYGWLGEALGSPGAAEAVEQAVVRNALAIVVPCHRLIRADGALGDYIGGQERKMALQKLEAASGG